MLFVCINASAIFLAILTRSMYISQSVHSSAYISLCIKYLFLNSAETRYQRIPMIQDRIICLPFREIAPHDATFTDDLPPTSLEFFMFMLVYFFAAYKGFVHHTIVFFLILLFCNSQLIRIFLPNNISIFQCIAFLYYDVYNPQK